MAPSTATISPIPVSSLSISGPKIVNSGAPSPKLDEFIRIRGVTASRIPSFRRLAAFYVSGNGSTSVEKSDVPFLNDYTELLEQARGAVNLAMKNDKQLMVTVKVE